MHFADESINILKMTGTYTPILSSHSTFVHGERKEGSRFGFLGWGVVIESNKKSFKVCNSQWPENCIKCTITECPIKRGLER